MRLFVASAMGLVVTMAKMHYRKVATAYVEKTLEWEIHPRWEGLSEEEHSRRIEQRLDKVQAGFAQWLEEESRRNDSNIRTAERTRRGQYLARELARAGVVDDPGNTR